MTTDAAWWYHQAKLILFDSGFWIGLIDNESDDYRAFIDYYIDCTFLIPYPSLAEFLNDAPLKNEYKLKILRDIFVNSAIKIQYRKYNLTEEEKDSILNDYFLSKRKNEKANRSGVPNFVDIVIGRIIEELNAHFVFVTINSGDFSKYIHSNKSLCRVIDFQKKSNGYWY